MKKYTFLILFFIIQFSFGQSKECGTVEPTGYSEAFAKIKEGQKSFKSRGNIMVLPIKAHIIRKFDETGGLTVNQLEEAVAIMNNKFIHSNIQFYLCDGINFINNSNLFDFNKVQEADMAQQNDAFNKINIY
nr:hypothetical protein [Bacteroidota bacterium]